MPYFPRPADGSRSLVWKTMFHNKETNFTRGSHVTTLKCPWPGQTREENSVLKLCQLVTTCSPMYCWYQGPIILSNLSDWVVSPGTTSETKLLPQANCMQPTVDTKWCTSLPNGHTEWTTMQPHQTANCYQLISNSVHPNELFTISVQGSYFRHRNAYN